MKLKSALLFVGILFMTNSAFALIDLECSVTKVEFISPGFKIKANDKVNIVEQNNSTKDWTRIYMFINGEQATTSGREQTNLLDLPDFVFEIDSGSVIRFSSLNSSGKSAVFMESTDGQKFKMADLACVLEPKKD